MYKNIHLRKEKKNHNAFWNKEEHPSGHYFCNECLTEGTPTKLDTLFHIYVCVCT